MDPFYRNVNRQDATRGLADRSGIARVLYGGLAFCCVCFRFFFVSYSAPFFGALQGSGSRPKNRLEPCLSLSFTQTRKTSCKPE